MGRAGRAAARGWPPDAPPVRLRVQVEPRWIFRLPLQGGADGVLRRRGGVVVRLLHVDGEPAVVQAAQPDGSRVVLAACGARREVAAEAIARMRFALGVDDDLREFYDRFRADPLIGRSIRARPWLRVRRRPEPFEALAWAICEQLIDFGRAAAIQRRIVFSLGRRWTAPGGELLHDPPAPDALGAVAPARLQAMDLSAGRALALVRAAREVAAGRVDLRSSDHERGWRRLRAIPGIGPWTVEMLALHGQGRYDQVPAGDLGLRKLAGRLATGDPRARAEEAEVRELFAPYDGWAGLAAAHAVGSAPIGPVPGGTRSSARPGWAIA